MDENRQLLLFRLLVLAGPLVMLAWLHVGLAVPLPAWPLLLSLALTAVTLYIQHDRHRLGLPTTPGMLLAYLLLDVLVLMVLLFASGGGTNPFVALLLLPLTLAAALLSAPLVWIMAAVTVAAYTLLMFVHLPLPGMLHGHGTGFTAHVWGMWLVFVVSALLLAGVVARMAAILRLRERQLSRLREQAMRDEQIVALGLFAAGAAHELGTPLSTMAVLTKELHQTHRDDESLAGDLAVLRDQVDACKALLAELLRSADLESDREAVQTLDALLEQTRNRWQLLKPQVPLRVHCQGPAPRPPVGAPHTIGRVLISLLDNAAAACPEGIELDGRWSGDRVLIEIRDRGILPIHSLNRAGETFFSTKPQGAGIGLLLANTVLERLGGQVSLERDPGGVTHTRIVLPTAMAAP